MHYTFKKLKYKLRHTCRKRPLIFFQNSENSLFLKSSVTYKNNSITSEDKIRISFNEVVYIVSFYITTFIIMISIFSVEIHFYFNAVIFQEYLFYCSSPQEIIIIPRHITQGPWSMTSVHVSWPHNDIGMALHHPNNDLSAGRDKT